MKILTMVCTKLRTYSCEFSFVLFVGSSLELIVLCFLQLFFYFFSLFCTLLSLICSSTFKSFLSLNRSLSLPTPFPELLFYTLLCFTLDLLTEFLLSLYHPRSFNIRTLNLTNFLSRIKLLPKVVTSSRVSSALPEREGGSINKSSEFRAVSSSISF